MPSRLDDNIIFLLFLGWAALALAGLLLFAADQNPGYSLSIYRELPLSFWALILVAIVSATLSVGANASETWILSVALLFASILVVLLAPAGLRYNIYGRADLLRHLGEIKHVSTHGTIRQNDFEALFHVHGAILSDVLGISISLVPYLLSVTAYTIYVLGFLVLFRRAGGNRKGLVTLVAILPVYGFFHTKIHPAFLSFFLLPTFIHVTLNNPTWRWGATFLLLGTTISLAHPLVLVGVLAVILLPAFGQLAISDRIALNMRKANIAPVIVGVVALVLIHVHWYVGFDTLMRRGLSLFIELIGGSETITPSTPGQPGASGSGGSTLPILGQAQKAIKNDFTVGQIGRIFLFRYGTIALLYATSCLAFGYYLYYGRFGDQQINRALLRGAAASMFALILLTGVLPVGTPLRSVRWVSFGAILFLGTFLSKEPEFKYERQIRVALIVVFATILVVSVFSVHLAPLNGKVNVETTEFNEAGSKWVFEREAGGVPIVYSHANLDRMMAYETTLVRVERRYSPIPNQFGYRSDQPICPETPCYLLTTDRDRKFPRAYPSNVRANINKYSAEDFERLNSDPAVSRVYVNGGYEVFYLDSK